MANKAINITRHAIVRYFNRITQNYPITDRGYDNWKKDHENEIREAEEKIRRLYETSEYITTGNYNCHRKSAYYINIEELITFIVSDNKLITMYRVDFGLDQKGNRQMFEVLFQNLHRVYQEEEDHDKFQQEETIKIERQSDLLNRELEDIRAKEQVVLSRKQELENRKKTLKAEADEITTRIKNIKEKLIKSGYALEGK